MILAQLARAVFLHDIESLMLETQAEMLAEKNPTECRLLHIELELWLVLYRIINREI